MLIKSTFLLKSLDYNIYKAWGEAIEMYIC